MKKHMCSTALLRAPSSHGDARITISTIDEDREGDILVPEGAILDAFNRNPVVLFGHDHSSIPVARAVHLVVSAGVGIQADFVWLKDDPFAERVRNAFDQGVLNAASVGFLPKTWEPNGTKGVRFTEWEMLEFSIVPVPANASAVRTLKQFGLDGPVPLMRATAVLDQLTSQLKDGRVLSEANAERLQQAQALLADVLVEEDDDEDDSEDETEEAALVLNEDGTIGTLSEAALESAIEHVVEGEMRRSSGEVIQISEAAVNSAIHAAVSQQVSKLTGRIPDDEPLLLATEDDGYQTPLDMEPEELAELIERTVRQAVNKGMAKITGRIAD